MLSWPKKNYKLSQIYIKLNYASMNKVEDIVLREAAATTPTEQTSSDMEMT